MLQVVLPVWNNALVCNHMALLHTAFGLHPHAVGGYCTPDRTLHNMYIYYYIQHLLRFIDNSYRHCLGDFYVI